MHQECREGRIFRPTRQLPRQPFAPKSPESTISSTTFPSKVIEIASRGLSLVSTRVSDVGDIFTDDAAWLLPQFSDRALSDILRDMARNPAEVRRRADAGQALARARFAPLAVGRALSEFLGWGRNPHDEASRSGSGSGWSRRTWPIWQRLWPDAGTTSTYVAEEELAAERAALGWQLPDVQGVALRFATNAKEATALVEEASADTVHLTQGLRSNGNVSSAQVAIRAAGSDTS